MEDNDLFELKDTLNCFINKYDIKEMYININELQSEECREGDPKNGRYKRAEITVVY